jgi:hypothetical protein
MVSLYKLIAIHDALMIATLFVVVTIRSRLPPESVALNKANVLPLYKSPYSVGCAINPFCIIESSQICVAPPDVTDMKYFAPRYVDIGSESIICPNDVVDDAYINDVIEIFASPAESTCLWQRENIVARSITDATQVLRISRYVIVKTTQALSIPHLSYRPL